MGTISLVAIEGGQTMARVFSETHSQITLVALRFSPARAWPAGAKRSPLPLGRAPTGRRTRCAAAATASEEGFSALGRTWRNNPQAEPNPERAADDISSL